MLLAFIHGWGEMTGGEEAMDKGEMISRGRTAEVFAWKDDQVLKLFLKDWPVRSVEHEAQVTGAVHKAGLPAPAVKGIVEVEGRLGIVLERIDGPSMMQVFRSRPWRIGQLARTLAELHAAIHSCEMPELPSLREDLGRGIREVELPEETKESVLRHLEQLPDGNTICHIDFHPDNVIMSSSGPVVIDWSNPRRGDPLADVAATSLLFRLAPLPQFMAGRWLINMFRDWFHSTYLERYLQLRPASRKQIAVWELPLVTARLLDNIPEERDLLLAFIEKTLSSQ
ncbi:MAG: phosphotransferase [Dehalococcoidales bacterium]|nr:phosphotransferase [Dehalococcoidales bacterium]